MVNAKQLVLAGFEQLNLGNIANFYALFADDVRYVTPAGTYLGREAARNADMAMFACLSRHWRVVERIVVCEPKVAVWLRFGAITKATGALIELELCDIFTIEDDHIRKLEIYGDFSPMFAALKQASGEEPESAPREASLGRALR
ncbi:MAG: nuclear transport factor 2 family protein [Myxococcales bacterium]|nr:nuclear transport factor 2 family protein [Myxococcales bacterium]